jgi:hypothetical protein
MIYGLSWDSVSALFEDRFCIARLNNVLAAAVLLVAVLIMRWVAITVTRRRWPEIAQN